MKYVYEEYETSWWRRFTVEEFEVERKIREDKDCGFFRTFETDENLGETVHLSNNEIKEIFKKDKREHPEKYMPSNAEYFTNPSRRPEQ